MPRQQRTTFLDVRARGNFLHLHYPHLKIGQRTASQVAEVERLAVQEWTDLTAGPASLSVMYQHPLADYREAELKTFGFPDRCTAKTTWSRLHSYKQVICHKLGIDSASLSGYAEYINHLRGHMQHEQTSAETEALTDDDVPAYKESARMWGAATRVFDCEMQLVVPTICPVCREFAFSRKGDQPVPCGVCPSRTARSANDLYAASNGLHPPPRPGILSNLTEAEESALSPLLPYICVTRGSASSRGVAFGHSFVVPQDTSALVKALPRLPAEMSSVILRGGSDAPSLSVDVRKLVAALDEFHRCAIMNQILRRNGVAISGADVCARLQEWEASNIRVPGAGPSGGRRRRVWDDGNSSDSGVECCAAGQFLPGDDSEDDDAGLRDGGPVSGHGIGIHDRHSGVASAATQQSVLPPVLDSSFAGAFARGADGICDPASTLRRPAPCASSRHVSDAHPDLWALSFPCLWFGASDFNFSLWGRDLELPSRSRWLRHLVNFADGRFAAHRLFVFIAQNWVQRHDVMQTANIYLKKGSSAASLTLSELRQAVDDGDDSILGGVLSFSRTVTGSVPYWRSIRQRVEHFAKWKWFTRSSRAEMRESWFAPPDDRYALELSGDEIELIGEVRDRFLVHAAVRSQHLYVAADEDTAPSPGISWAVQVFMQRVEDLYADILRHGMYDDWFLHTAMFALQFKATARLSSLFSRAEAALALTRAAFLYDHRDAGSGDVARLHQQWCHDYAGHLPPADVEPFLHEPWGADLDDPESYAGYESHMASQFRWFSGTHVGRNNPSFFLTGSMAELHWDDLWRVMEEYVRIVPSNGDEWLLEAKANGLSRPRMRSEALRRYPHMSTSFFRVRTQALYRFVLKPVLGVDDYFIKYEFAEGRGEIHFHSLNWSSRHNVSEWLEDGDDNKVLEFARRHLRLSAVHPGKDLSSRSFDPHVNPAGCRLRRPALQHPCRQVPTWMSPADLSSWDTDLVNMCFTHSCRNNKYCLRKKPYATKAEGQTPGTPGDRHNYCRFGFHVNNWFGKATVPPAEAGVEQEGDRSVLVMERDDPRISQSSEFFRRVWKANCDLQVVCTSDMSVVCSYIIGYLCKEAEASSEYKRIFRTLLRSEALHTPAQAFRRLFLAVLGHRDKSAQEVLYTVAGNPFFDFSRMQGPAITVTDLRRLVAADGTTAPSLADRYASTKSGKSGVTLYEFAMDGEPDRVVAPVGNFHARWPLTDDYAFNVLALHCPWTASPRDTLRSSLGDGRSYLSFRAKFLADFLYTPACPLFIYQDVTRARLAHQNPSKARKPYYSVGRAGRGKVAPFLRAYALRDFDADLNNDAVGSVSFNPAPPGYNWSSTDRWPGGSFDLEAALATAAHPADASSTTAAALAPDPPPFNVEQAAAWAILAQHCHAMLDRPPRARPDQLRMILSGAGGCGKSFVIQHMRAAMQAVLGDRDAMVVLAPTGAAAAQVDGETIHRGVGISVNNEFSTGPALRRVADSLRWCKYLVLDECSMISQRLFALVEQRISDLLGVCDDSASSWRGLWGVILVGDDAQLPPVNGHPLFDAAANAKPEEMRALALHRQFCVVVNLTVNLRLQPSASGQTAFEDLLHRIRTGNPGPGDLQALNRRSLGALPPDEAARFSHDNAQFLVTHNAERIQRNLDHIAAAPGPIEEVVARESGSSRHLAAADSPTLFSMLQPVLWLGPGVRVSVTSNLRTSAGIVRGALGTVELVVYEPGARPPALPAVVLVRMDRGVHPMLRDSLHLGPDFADVLPFAPSTARCPDGCCTRMQVPLELARAMTVHKSQGATIARPTVVELSAKAERRWPGLTYTALSRFRSFEPFALARPITKDLLAAVRAGVTASGRRDEIHRLETLADQTKRVYGECFASLHCAQRLYRHALAAQQARTRAAAAQP